MPGECPAFTTKAMENNAPSCVVKCKRVHVNQSRKVCMSSAYKDWQIRGHGLTPARHVLCVTVRSVCRTAGHNEGLRAGLIVAPCQSGDPTHLKTQHGLIQQLSRSPIQGYVHHCPTRKSMQQEPFRKENIAAAAPAAALCARTNTMRADWLLTVHHVGQHALPTEPLCHRWQLCLGRQQGTALRAGLHHGVVTAGQAEHRSCT